MPAFVRYPAMLPELALMGSELDLEYSGYSALLQAAFAVSYLPGRGG